MLFRSPLWAKFSQRVMAELGLESDEELDYFDLISARFLDRSDI